MAEATPEATPERDEWMRRAGPLYPGLIALWTLSAVPRPRGLTPSRDDLTRSAPWLPLLGAGLGLAVYGAAVALLGVGFVPLLAAVLVALVALAVTAAQLERGVARMVERLGHAPSRAQAAALVVVAVRMAALAGTHTSAWLAALVCMHVIARWALLFLVTIGDHVDEPRPPGARALPPAGTWSALGVSTLLAAVIAVTLGGGVALAGWLVAAATAFIAGLVAQQKSGLTDSALLTAAAAAELAVLLVFAAAYPAVSGP